jgi:hypothetical protein
MLRKSAVASRSDALTEGHILVVFTAIARRSSALETFHVKDAKVQIKELLASTQPETEKWLYQKGESDDTTLV